MKKNSLPQPITILVLTLLTALVWVGLSIYRTATVKPGVVVPEDISKPINPVLNSNVIQKIESAIFLQDSEIPEITITGSANTIIQPTTVPTATSTPEATVSASPPPQP